jgi:hypothetical protein
VSGVVRKTLLAIFPGEETWLWRRASCITSIGVLLYCIVLANGKADSALVAQNVIGLLGVLGIYTGGAVTESFKKKDPQP